MDAPHLASNETAHRENPSEPSEYHDFAAFPNELKIRPPVATHLICEAPIRSLALQDEIVRDLEGRTIKLQPWLVAPFASAPLEMHDEHWRFNIGKLLREMRRFKDEMLCEVGLRYIEEGQS